MRRVLAVLLTLATGTATAQILELGTTMHSEVVNGNTRIRIVPPGTSPTYRDLLKRSYSRTPVQALNVMEFDALMRAKPYTAPLASTTSGTQPGSPGTLTETLEDKRVKYAIPKTAIKTAARQVARLNPTLLVGSAAYSYLTSDDVVYDDPAFPDDWSYMGETTIPPEQVRITQASNNGNGMLSTWQALYPLNKTYANAASVRLAADTQFPDGQLTGFDESGIPCVWKHTANNAAQHTVEAVRENAPTNRCGGELQFVSFGASQICPDGSTAVDGICLDPRLATDGEIESSIDRMSDADLRSLDGHLIANEAPSWLDMPASDWTAGLSPSSPTSFSRTTSETISNPNGTTSNVSYNTTSSVTNVENTTVNNLTITMTETTIVNNPDAPEASPTPAPSPSPSPTPTPDPSATPTPTPDPSATPTPTPDPFEAPGLPEARTFTESLNVVGSAFANITGAFNPQIQTGGGQCPVGQFPYAGQTFVIDAHCALFDQFGPTFTLLMTVMWSLGALFLFFKA